MGEPIIGANVFIKGTTNGTITNITGNFKLEDVPQRTILQISYIGFKNMEIPGKGQPFCRELQEDTETLDEVIVVGYTAQRKEDLDHVRAPGLGEGKQAERRDYSQCGKHAER